MEKYNYNIKIINHIKDIKNINGLKKYLLKVLQDIAGDFLPWNCEITVHLLNDLNDKKFDAWVHAKDKKYNLFIYKHTFISLYCGNYKYFFSIITHEFEYIYDIQNAISFPFTKYDFTTKKFRSPKEYFAKMGFSFWIEYMAHC